MKIKDHSLYLVITEEYGMGRSAMDIAKLSIAGGVDIIQLREKNKQPGEIVKTAKELSLICKNNRVIFIVNDDPHIAKESDADGVHLGQEDMRKFSVKEARRILGTEKIIGISTESLSQVKSANKEEVDYIAYGPVFCTEVKDKCVGIEDVGKILEIARKPVFFIGGIDLCNVDELLQKGAKNIALIRAILRADNITAKTKAFKEKLLEGENIENG